MSYAGPILKECFISSSMQKPMKNGSGMKLPRQSLIHESFRPRLARINVAVHTLINAKRGQDHPFVLTRKKEERSRRCLEYELNAATDPKGQAANASELPSLPEPGPGRLRAAAEKKR